jgi:hypothetical protein
MNDLTQAGKLIKKCQETQNPYLNLEKCGITNLYSQGNRLRIRQTEVER